MYDDHEKETLQTDAETVEKTIDQRSFYPAERCDDWQGRDRWRVRWKMVACPRSMTIKAYIKLVKGVCIDEAYRDSQHVTVHVRLTPETKDSIDKDVLIKDTEE